MATSPQQNNWIRHLWLVLFATLVLRMVAMWTIPLTDTTEARYGEIARKMMDTNNWITPLHQYGLATPNTELNTCCYTTEHGYGVPFWAKPPLSTWVAAISMKIFGVNEFAARLPSLLFCLAILYLIYQWLKPRANHLGLVAITVLATSLLFCGGAGLVMTDLALIFCSALAMMCFWKAVVDDKGKIWGYLFFASLGLGLLAKGPLILVLVGLPTGLWTLLHGQLIIQWKRLPWITGLVLTIAIAGPWYWIAEQQTPGFIQYFIVGEHFSRFMISGWSGDRYGHAHSEPLGMIWLYLFGGFLPWFGLVLVKLVKHKREIAWRYPIHDTWMSYLLLWSIMPVIFFTFAHNIISPYALPAMPACAILFAELFVGFTNAQKPFNPKPLFWLALFTPVILLTAMIIYIFLPASASKRSEKDLVKIYFETRKDEHSDLVYYKERLYSSEFYSYGKAHVVDNAGDVAALLNNSSQDFVALDSRYADAEVTTLVNAHFKKLAEFHKVSLYQECVSQTACQ